MTIPRDLGSPFDPADPIELAEFWGFGPDVPNTRGIIAATRDIGTTHALLTAVPAGALDSANRVRAAKLFSEPFLAQIAATGGANGDDFPTPDEVPAEEVTARFMRSGRAKTVDIFPPGNFVPNSDVQVWSFEGVDGGFIAPDPAALPPIVGDGGVAAVDMWPAPTMRVVEGNIVHVQMSNSHGSHTIHHHGIEPTPVNDGVGHLTMEVGGALVDELGNPLGDGSTYKYQWKAGEAGTYFYHCHRNTVLHFELGMYGLLIIDTPAPAGAPIEIEAPYESFGPGYTLVSNNKVLYDKETFWVVDDIDISWHGFDRSSGIPAPALDGAGNPVFSLAGANNRLNDFHPDFFVVTGVTVGTNGVLELPVAFRTADNAMYAPLYEAIQPKITRSENLLIRAVNASYCITVWRFPAGLDGTVVAVDGRTLGWPGFGNYSYPFRISDLPLDQTGQHRTFTFTTAQRWDILINTDESGGILGINAGIYEVLVEFRHWNDYDHILQTAILPVTVTSVTSVT